MKKVVNISLMMSFLLILLLFSSCDKSFDGMLEGEEYLIFGTFYGECIGNCLIAYKIQENQLFEDDEDFGPFDGMNFKPDALSNEQFELAKLLLDDFPIDLLDSDKLVYGCPDCSDQGGVYLELKSDGLLRNWRIDMFNNEQSQEIVNYKRQIIEIINAL